MSYARINSSIIQIAPIKPIATQETKLTNISPKQEKEKQQALSIISKNSKKFQTFSSELDYKITQYPNIFEAVQKGACLQELRNALDTHVYDLIETFSQDNRLVESEEIRRIKAEYLKEKIAQLEKNSLKNQILEIIKKNVNKHKNFEDLVTEPEYKNAQYPKIMEATKYGASLQELQSALGTYDCKLIEQMINDNSNDTDPHVSRIKNEFYSQKKALEDKINEENQQSELKLTNDAIRKIGVLLFNEIASFGLHAKFNEKDTKELCENYVPRFIKAGGNYEDLYGVIPFSLICKIKLGEKGCEPETPTPTLNILGL